MNTDVLYPAVKSELIGAGVNTEAEVRHFIQGVSDPYAAATHVNTLMATILGNLRTTFRGQYISRRLVRAFAIRALREGALS